MTMPAVYMSMVVNGRQVIDYDGNNIGFNAEMAYYPNDGLAAIVLAN